VRLDTLPENKAQAGRLKFEILASGLRLTESAKEALFGSTSVEHARSPIRTRSGVSGGLDLRLSEEVFVNAPILEPFARDSHMVLDWTETGFTVSKNGENIARVEPLPEPKYYSQQTKDGVERMVRVGQMCSPDRFCYGMTGPACVFWAPHDRCRFCSIGFNAPADASRKREEHLYDALRAAMAEPEWPARHVLLGGGTPRGPDMGALLAAKLCQGIKRFASISVYVMIVAPLDNCYIDALHDAGVDELGLNLEFWGETAWDHYIPGKRDRVGKKRYLQALEFAVSRFGPIRTRSILIAGLEPAEDTLLGVQGLARMGVMPILSPFRPLSGTALADRTGFSTKDYVQLYEEAHRLANEQGLPLGPTCVCCQNNTLALPFGPQYRWY
jgi:hypothetical protein